MNPTLEGKIREFFDDEDLAELLTAIRESGGLDCTGDCHRHKPGETHCTMIAQGLGLSSTGVKDRVQRLIEMRLVSRRRIKRENTTPLFKFTITPVGEKILQFYQKFI